MLGAVPAVPATPAAPSTLSALARLARPRGGAALLVYPLTGYGFALWDHSAEVRGLLRLALVCVSWFVASAGTMWLNARLDGEEGGALFAEAPTRAPRHLAAFGHAAIAVGLGVAWLASDRIFAVCAVCAALSLAYSSPRTRWKGHPVLGPAVNAVGYGLLSPLAGFLAVGVALTPRAAIVLACLSLWTLGAAFAAQAFQRDDDARRGYRTLVVTHGPATCLRVARLTTWAPIAALTAMAIVGLLPRVLLLGVPYFAVVDRHVARWLRQPHGGDASWAAGYMARMLGGGALLVSLATVDFLYDFMADRPAAGLATARGAPRSP